jgi:predicted dehydrogenase
MHVPAWLEMPELVRVVAVADPDPDARQRVGRIAGLAETDAYAEAGQLLAREDVAVVDVCTPQAFRRDVLVRAAEAGKHILCEKPLATTPADAAAAVEAAASNGVLLGIVHNYLTTPEVIAARQVIDSGEIGAVRSVIVNMLGAVYETGAAGDWRHDPALSGGGVLMDLIHGIYLAEALVGEPILRVSAYVGQRSPDSLVEDLVTCRLETADRVALFNVGWGFGAGGYTIAGTGGRVDVRFEHGSTPPWANLEQVTVTTASGTREVIGAATERRIGLGDFPSHASAFRRLARSLAEAAHGRGAPIATGADGLRTLEAAIAAYVSGATGGGAVSLPLDRDSVPFQRGAIGVPAIGQAEWSPFAGTSLFRASASPSGARP